MEESDTVFLLLVGRSEIDKPPAPAVVVGVAFYKDMITLRWIQLVSRNNCYTLLYFPQFIYLLLTMDLPQIGDVVYAYGMMRLHLSLFLYNTLVYFL
jgi:hypothetical protein